MTTINNAWLIYQPAQKHLLVHAQDCAQHLGTTLEPLALASLLANAPEYLAQKHHVVSYTHGRKAAIIKSPILPYPIIRYNQY